MDLTRLFNRRDLRSLSEEKRAGLLAEVGSAPDDHVLAVVAQEWADALVKRYRLDVPELHTAERWMEEPEEIQYDVSHEGFSRALPSGGGPFFVRGTRHVVHIPFFGDPEILLLRPSSFTSSGPPAGHLRGSDVLVTVEYSNDSARDIGAQVDATTRVIEQWLDFARSDAVEHNRQLLQQALPAIVERQREIKAKRERIAASGIPVRAPGALKPPIIRAIVRRPSRLPLQSSSGAPIPLDPALPEDVYPDILAAIAQAARDMERSRDTYAGMGEEDRRQILLLALNGQYRGLTTAEAFNVKGKTDLRIQYEGRNLFIAECKKWNGQASVTKTIDQLFTYTGWQDTKLAVVMFVEQKSLTDIVDKGRTAMLAHPQFVEERGGADELELRARMRWPGDDQRVIDIAVRFIPA